MFSDSQIWAVLATLATVLVGMLGYMITGVERGFRSLTREMHSELAVARSDLGGQTSAVGGQVASLRRP